MARKITFIHAADLHIGAPMRGFCSLSDAWRERLLSALTEAYDRIVDTALARCVDFVVIAGDVFDTSRPSYGDYRHFFDGIARLSDAGIPVYLVAGNHDPFSSWSSDVDLLPSGVRLMGSDAPEFALFEREGEPTCLIGARGYRTQAWTPGTSIADGISRAEAVAALADKCPDAKSAPFSIGILHTGLDLDQSKAYSDPAALLASDIDYWACGHLHKRYIRPKVGSPRIVFPGCVQGRDLKESGSRGCYLVTMKEREGMAPPRIDLEFVPTASVVFQTIRVDVSACRTLADIRHLVRMHLFHESGAAQCEEMVVRVELVGTTELHEYLVKPDIIADLRKRINDSYPTFFCDLLLDRTSPVRDRVALEHEGLFPAQVIHVSDEQRSHGAEMINYVQSEFVKRGIDVPSSLVNCIDECGVEAETLVLDLLEGAFSAGHQDGGR